MSSSGPTVSPSHLDQLRTMLVEKEYEYLTQSSFHSDGLRNQIIQFYLVLVGGAATALVGLAQLESKSNSQAVAMHIQSWVLGFVALFIGFVGICMIPIFARLRNNVLECLQGTVLLKRLIYCGTKEDDIFRSAMLWDEGSLPHDEKYLTASFMLVFIFMMLDSGMIGLSFFLWQYEVIPLGTIARLGWHSIAVGILSLTVQVILYRVLLYHAMTTSLESNRLEEKLRTLGLITKDDTLKHPQLRKPIFIAGLVGALLSSVLFVASFFIS